MSTSRLVLTLVGIANAPVVKIRASSGARRWIATLVILSATVTCVAHTASAEESTLDEPEITAADREHWSFRPLVRPDVPGSSQEGENPIDAFVNARLRDEGIEPLGEADRYTLLRRVTFDLTGLPPTPGEIEAFIADRAPGAYERVVERLLASPAHGERWAQHWLDLVRFAETDGFEHDKYRPDAWRYRDWVIDALNRDMPYDEFVRLQLAGDELRPDDETAAVATGFLTSGPDMPDINSQTERRHVFLNDLASTVGSVLLGVQIGCAQCHDHKYDPISQADFYRLRAVFEPAFTFKRDQLVGAVVRGERLPAEPSHLMIRGDYRRPGAELSPGYPRIANPWDASVPASDEMSTSTGRRAALAAWVTRPDHPLAARVIVNRLWQHHFGRPLAETPSDFGVMGGEPTHPELLDWLATEAPRRGWSLKAMHRLMVGSATYRRASFPATDASSAVDEAWRRMLRGDPHNESLARMNRVRLDGEVIRDALLAVSDRLNRQAGGPGVKTTLPAEMLDTLPAGAWKPDPDEENHRRRSIYLFVGRNVRHPLFEAFDRPDMNASCARRDRSTTAPQALWMFNSEAALAAARSLAEVVLGSPDAEESKRLEQVYLRALGRPPSVDETEQMQAFLAAATAEQAAPESAWTDLCLAILNLNEFIYVD